MCVLRHTHTSSYRSKLIAEKLKQRQTSQRSLLTKEGLSQKIEAGYLPTGFHLHVSCHFGEMLLLEAYQNLDGIE